MKTDVSIRPLQEAAPGDLVIFGTYPRLLDGTAEPIRWIVLEKSDGALLLLSEEIVDCKRYHSGDGDSKSMGEKPPVSWAGCELRAWLNDAFLHRAFSAAEQRQILPTRCTDNGEGSPDTEDRVFLLSEQQLLRFAPLHSQPLRKAVGTPFAKAPKADGCRLYVYNKAERENYKEVEGEPQGLSWWWLRTRGNRSWRVCMVGTLGTVRHYEEAHLHRVGVRPAIRIKVKNSG